MHLDLPQGSEIILENLKKLLEELFPKQDPFEFNANIDMILSLVY